MLNPIDISARITNELPRVIITDDLIVTVNNRKSTILCMKGRVEETEKKAMENGGEFDEMKLMDSVLEMLVGKKSADAINKIDLPLPEFKIVYQAVMTAATGQSQDETPIQ